MSNRQVRRREAALSRKEARAQLKAMERAHNLISSMSPEEKERLHKRCEGKTAFEAADSMARSVLAFEVAEHFKQTFPDHVIPSARIEGPREGNVYDFVPKEMIGERVHNLADSITEDNVVEILEMLVEKIEDPDENKWHDDKLREYYAKSKRIEQEMPKFEKLHTGMLTLSALEHFDVLVENGVDETTGEVEPGTLAVLANAQAREYFRGFDWEWRPLIEEAVGTDFERKHIKDFLMASASMSTTGDRPMPDDVARHFAGVITTAAPELRVGLIKTGEIERMEAAAA
jgi:hypothetical protein